MGVGSSLRTFFKRTNLLLFIFDIIATIGFCTMFAASISAMVIFGGHLTYIVFDILTVCAAITVVILTQMLFLSNVNTLQKSIAFGVFIAGWFFLVAFLQIVIFIHHITLIFSIGDWSAIPNDIFICVIIAGIIMGIWLMYTDNIAIHEPDNEPQKNYWINLFIMVGCALLVIIWLSTMFAIDYVSVVTSAGMYWVELLQNMQYIFVVIGAIVFGITSRFIAFKSRTRVFWLVILWAVLFVLFALLVITLNILCVVLIPQRLIVIERMIFLIVIGFFYVGGRYLYAFFFNTQKMSLKAALKLVEDNPDDFENPNVENTTKTEVIIKDNDL